MKLLIGASLLAFGVGAMAEEEAAPAASGTQMLDKMQAELALSDEQRTAIAALFEERREARETAVALARESGDRMAAREHMEAARAQMNEKLGEILTEDQMAQFEEMRPELQGMAGMDQGRRGMDRGRRGDGPRRGDRPRRERRER